MAVALLNKRSASSKAAAAKLLLVASADGDYLQAKTLLQVMKSADCRVFCVRSVRFKAMSGHDNLVDPRELQV